MKSNDTNCLTNKTEQEKETSREIIIEKVHMLGNQRMQNVR